MGIKLQMRRQPCQASTSRHTLVFCSSWTLFKARWIGFVCMLTGELRGPRFQDLSPVMTLMGHILIKCWVDRLISFVFGFMECDVTFWNDAFNANDLVLMVLSGLWSWEKERAILSCRTDSLIHSCSDLWHFVLVYFMAFCLTKRFSLFCFFSFVHIFFFFLNSTYYWNNILECNVIWTLHCMLFTMKWKCIVVHI